MAENINKTESNFEIVIAGRLVSKKQLVNAWRFYTRYSLVGGESCCHICDVCKECCQHCEEESAYWDSVNSEIDKRRGK